MIYPVFKPCVCPRILHVSSSSQTPFVALSTLFIDSMDIAIDQRDLVSGQSNLDWTRWPWTCYPAL